MIDLARFSRYNLGVRTITIHEAETNISQYLVAIEKGEEFVVTRKEKPIAFLKPVLQGVSGPRPKVGETLGPRFSVPDSAFAPLTEEEMKDWTG